MLNGSILDKIIAARKLRLEATQQSAPLQIIRKAAESRTDYRDFAAAIAKPGLSVIAEIKQASPSRGMIRPEYHPREIAESYQRAGASAISVLTEEEHFLGSLNDLIAVGEAAWLPVLRKDFILDEYQVYESAAAGADALLLIVAALADEKLRELISLASELRVAALVEIHTEDELDRAVAAGAKIIGVNNRNLKTLTVDLETSLRLHPHIPKTLLTVSESGIKAGSDLNKLARSGFDAVLIGEHFMLADDPGQELAAMLSSASISTAVRI